MNIVARITVPNQFRCLRLLGSSISAPPRSQSGFSLIELLVVVVILAIAVAVAAPSMGAMISNNRIQGAASDLYADLTLARGTAAAKGQRVTICQSSDSATCTGASTWQSGWIVFVDADGNGTFEGPTSTPTAGNDILIKAHEAVNINLTVAPYSAAGSPPALTSSNTTVTSVRYRPSGPTTSTTALGFRICQNGYANRDIVINTLGKVTASTSTTPIATQTATDCS